MRYFSGERSPNFHYCLLAGRLPGDSRALGHHHTSVDGVVESQPAFFYQHHGGDCRDGLGHKSKAEDRIPPPGYMAVEGHGAHRVQVLLPMVVDERNNPLEPIRYPYGAA